MGGTILRNARLHLTSPEFDGADSLAVQDHRIIPVNPALFEDGTSEEINLNGLHVAPGLIDLLVNGCAGVTFGNDLSAEGLEKMRRYQTQHGTLTFVPTLSSGPRENMTKAINVIDAFKENHPGVCPGLHLEGPFINSERKGFHPVGCIRSIMDADISFLREHADTIAYMTIAPEVVRGKQLLDLLVAGIKLSMGHSNAGFTDALTAMRAGVTNITHLYSGMRPMTGREPGILGAALNFDGVSAGVIADGRHVHPAIIRILHKLLGDRLYIVSDSRSVAGAQEQTSFTIAGTEVFVDPNRGLIDAKSSLAGTNVTLLDEVRYLVRVCDFTLDEALAAASTVPAQVLGIDNEYGRIGPGFMADLIIFDDEFRIRCIIQNGFMKNSAEFLQPEAECWSDGAMQREHCCSSLQAESAAGWC